MRTFIQFLRESTPDAPGDLNGFFGEIDAVASQHPMLGRNEVILQGSVIVELRPQGNHVYLTALRSAAQGTGAGSKAMQQIVDIADRHGVTLKLLASPLKLHPSSPIAKTPKAKLVAFYTRFGFVPDRTMSGRDAMVRLPRSQGA